MITEDYVSFETAKLLKEKGFDGECDLFGRTDESELIIREASKIAYNQGIDDECVILPTLQMAMKWLREAHNLYTEIMVGDSDERIWYDFDVINIGKKDIPIVPIDVVELETYEQACEAAIKYCLENLI